MRILVVTNLYPPQNLGGFGLCIERLADGLRQQGHLIKVLSTNQTYLGDCGDSLHVERSLELLGSYDGGLSHLAPGVERRAVQHHNKMKLAKALELWRPDAALVGNLDLLGIDLLYQLLESRVRCLQHVGFLSPPFPLEQFPWQHTMLYTMAFASAEVKRMLCHEGFPVEESPVIYPPLSGSMNSVPLSVGSSDQAPLRVGYSGLLMASKGVHRLLEAVNFLKQEGQRLEVLIAGKAFSQAYQQQLEQYCLNHGISSQVRWLGFVEPDQLSGFYLQLDVLVFPSIYPESFGMVVAEAMAHGVVPISTGAGGAFEVITHGRNGWLVEPDHALSIASALRKASRMKRCDLRRLGFIAQHDARMLYSQARSTSSVEAWLMMDQVSA